MMLFSAMCFLLLETEKYGRVRAVFDGRPWKNMKGLMEEPDNATSVESKIKMCPFTGQEAHGTCPICHSIVSYDGYYRVSTLMQCFTNSDSKHTQGDPPILHSVAGDSILEHRLAMQASESDNKPRLGRIQLDTLIKYRGNFLFATISPSCKGCYVKAWCWTVGYRMVWQSTILGFNTMLCSYLFGEDVNAFDLKSTLLCLSMFFSVSTVCMLLSLLATAITFVREHPFMLEAAGTPKFLARDMGVLEKLILRMADPCAKFGVNPTKIYWKWLWSIKKS